MGTRKGPEDEVGGYFSKDIRSMNSSLDGPILVKHNTRLRGNTPVMALYGRDIVDLGNWEI
jgi:hypothetical protein